MASTFLIVLKIIYKLLQRENAIESVAYPYYILIMIFFFIYNFFIFTKEQKEKKGGNNWCKLPIGLH